MVILLYGPNGHLRRAEYKKEARVFSPDDASIPEIISCEDDACLDPLYATLSFQGLFGGDAKSVCAIRDINLISNSKELKGYLHRASNDPNRLVCIIESWPKESIPVYAKKLFADCSITTRYCPQYSPQHARDQLAQECATRGGVCESAGLDALFSVCHADMDEALNEMEKLLLLGEPITVAVVRRFLWLHQPPALFAFSSALWASHARLSVVLPMWEQLIVGRPESSEFFGMFGYFAKSSSTIGAVRRLAQADIKIKSGLLEPDQALLEVILATAIL